MQRILLIAMLTLTGCGQASDDTAPPATPDVLRPDEGTIQLTAKQAYDKVCADPGYGRPCYSNMPRTATSACPPRAATNRSMTPRWKWRPSTC